MTKETNQNSTHEQGVINLPTGQLSLDALRQMINVLPFEITYSDENDQLMYYSDNDKRINGRSEDNIGQPFISVFAPEEQPAIENILSDFHKGAADHFEQWYPQNNRTVYNNFYAVRDVDGTFLGTVQFTGDITRIQGFRGVRTTFNAGKSDK